MLLFSESGKLSPIFLELGVAGQDLLTFALLIFFYVKFHLSDFLLTSLLSLRVPGEFICHYLYLDNLFTPFLQLLVVMITVRRPTCDPFQLQYLRPFSIILRVSDSFQIATVV